MQHSIGFLEYTDYMYNYVNVPYADVTFDDVTNELLITWTSDAKFAVDMAGGAANHIVFITSVPGFPTTPLLLSGNGLTDEPLPYNDGMAYDLINDGSYSVVSDHLINQSVNVGSTSVYSLQAIPVATNPRIAVTSTGKINITSSGAVVVFE